MQHDGCDESNVLVSIGGVNYCDQPNSGIPWRTQFKLAGTIPLPWHGIILSGSYQGLPGYSLGTSAITPGGAGAPNFTSLRYAVCPGNSAAQGCVVGAIVAPGLVGSSLSVPLMPPGRC